jgi:ArsR family metal-binding transcriptional regulator
MTNLLDDFTGKPCNRGTAYEFFPKKTTIVNMETAAELLGKFEIHMQSKFLILLNIGEKTVSVFHSGKIMVRGERDEDKAREIAEQIITTIEKCLTLVKEAKENA